MPEATLTPAPVTTSRERPAGPERTAASSRAASSSPWAMAPDPRPRVEWAAPRRHGAGIESNPDRGRTDSMSEIAERGYAHPEALVSTEWVAAHLDDPGVRIVESDEDALLYASGHVPGAVEVDWTRDLNDPVERDYLDGERFAA